MLIMTNPETSVDETRNENNSLEQILKEPIPGARFDTKKFYEEMFKKTLELNGRQIASDIISRAITNGLISKIRRIIPRKAEQKQVIEKLHRIFSGDIATIVDHNIARLETMNDDDFLESYQSAVDEARQHLDLKTLNKTTRQRISDMFASGSVVTKNDLLNWVVKREEEPMTKFAVKGLSPGQKAKLGHTK